VLSNQSCTLNLIGFFLFLHRPLPPLPNLEVSDAVVEKAADYALVWINRLLAVGHDIAIKRNRKVFIKVSLFL
jgi:reticulon-3